MSKSEIRNETPSISSQHTVPTLRISFFYSTLIGIVSRSLFAYTYISSYLTSPSIEIVPDKKFVIAWLETKNIITRIPFKLFGMLDEPFYVTIFHHMLIPFSIFAIFIGVCLQSIFGDKSAVEPL